MCGSNKENIRIFEKKDSKTVEVWSGSETYGGTYKYLEFQPDVMSTSKSRYYIPQQFYITDIKGNNKNEVIVIKNHDMAGVFQKSRHFNKGHIETLAWNGAGLAKTWERQNFNGFISDIFIGDLNNDGKDEIICSVVNKSKSFFGSSTSNIVTWTF